MPRTLEVFLHSSGGGVMVFFLTRAADCLMDNNGRNFLGFVELVKTITALMSLHPRRCNRGGSTLLRGATDSRQYSLRSAQTRRMTANGSLPHNDRSAANFEDLPTRDGSGLPKCTVSLPLYLHLPCVCKGTSLTIYSMLRVRMDSDA
eukprot:1262164-Amphidinium_carterae.1